ncbi:HtaA domain-containing protein [Agromyces sp. LHK192]|uniref:HtaA domain-containing protein n=1 Tax=Agromyces sp. LHK192 TaxID=2498704 RepID=UPI0013E39D38|nr:HtaA domain-containing protein [Agromyces sp. LHK192]
MLASLLTGTLVASAAVVGIAAPAQAEPADVETATLDWGVKQSFRGYIVSPIAHGSIGLEGTTQNADGSFRWTGGTGTVDVDVPSADADFAGGVHFTGHDGQLDLLIENPRVDVDGAVGTLYVDVTSKALSGGTFDQDDVAFATLALGAPAVAGDVATWSGAASSLTASGAEAFGGFYTAGTALDPLTFSLPYEVVVPEPTVTATTLVAAPAGPVQEGTSVTFTATVAPSAAGTVQFSDAAGALGAPVAVAGDGTASFTSSSLAVGTHDVTAAFTPADPAAFVASTSTAVQVVIEAIPAPTADRTATSLTAAPARVRLGETVTLEAVVANTDDAAVLPTGRVEFFDLGVGASRTSIGSAGVVDGKAVLTSATLAAGGHSFEAVYSPSGSDFVGSTSTKTGNVGVVDTSVPAVCTPAAGAATATGATATWGWSAYSNGWTKVAGGDVSVAGQDFALANGTVTADPECAQVSFTGTLRTQAYESFFPPNGNWIELVDPTLTISADGSGSWAAGVRTGVGAYDATAAAPRLTVATFSGQTVGGPGVDGSRTLTPAYLGTVAPGTFSVANGVAYANSWPTAFVLAAPASIQSFYYQTSESAAQATKPASPISVDFEWPAVTSTEASVAPATRAILGADVTLSATVTPSTVPGSVEFFATPAGGAELSLGTADVAEGAATLVTDELAAGGHALRAVFTPTNGFDSSSVQISPNYGVVDTTPADVCALPADAEVLTGVSAEWGWSGYSDGWTKVAGGNVALDGETFALSNGTARVSDDCTVVSFTGTLRTQAYEGFFPPAGQWIELVDPTLVLDADGNGAWTAGVRSGVAAYSAAPAPRLTVATITGVEPLDFSGDALDANVDLDFADTVAPATWSNGGGVNWTNAWANEFIVALPSAIQAFYYQSGTSAANLTKPPAPVSVAWEAAAPAVTIAAPSGPIVPGTTLTFSGSGFRQGEQIQATVYSDPIDAGTAVADATGTFSLSWTVPADLPVGEHRIELAGERSGVASATFTVAASAIAAPGAQAPAAAPEQVCVARDVSGATLDWGVKESFRSYVTGPIAGGSISTSGATTVGGEFRWTGGDGAYNTDANRGRVSYDGSVHFTGHAGQLDLTIANPRVQVNGGSAVLIADLSSKGMNGAAGVDASGIVIATLGLPEASVSGDEISWSGASATLTAAGAEAFGGFYQAGQALDPVSFSFPLGAKVPCDTTTTGELGATGVDLTVAWIALALLVLGGGAAFVTRRRKAARI